MLDQISQAISKVVEDEEKKLFKRLSKRQAGSKPAIPESEGSRRHSKSATVNSDIIYEEDEDDLVEDHTKWEGNVLPHMVAYVVGLGNVWRFPYLCHHYGGAAFLIPYAVFLLLGAYPYIYLELLVGQFAQVGTIAAFKICPLFKGVGICMTFMTFVLVLNIQPVLAWCLFYLFQSIFHSPLPWVSCDNGFGKMQNGQQDTKHVRLSPGSSDEEKNWHTVNCTEFYADSGTDIKMEEHERLPGSEYFQGRVQRMWRSGFGDREHNNYTGDNGAVRFGFEPGNNRGFSYNLDTFVALFGTFLIIQIFLQRGTRVNGTFVGLLIAIPYIIMVLLFYRASTLSGAWSGLNTLFEPVWSQLEIPETWWVAAEQVFRSTGAGTGIYLTIASHTQRTRYCLADATRVIAINTMTTLFSSSVIFMLLGHIRDNVNHDIDKFALSGPELVFEVMADVFGVIAKPNFYSSCFYFMLFLLGLTTVTTSLVCAKTAFLEVLPIGIKYRPKSRVLLICAISLFSLIVSSLSLTRGGLHTFNYIETFIWSFSAIITAILFLVGVVWFWGLEEIVAATQDMGIREPGIYFQLCWKFIIIGLLVIVFGLAFNPTSHEVIVDRTAIEISFTLTAIGYGLAILPSILIFIGAFHAISKISGKDVGETMLLSISPTRDHAEIKEFGGDRSSLSHYLYLYASSTENACRLFCGGGGARHNQVGPDDSLSGESVATVSTVKTEESRKSKDSHAAVIVESAESGGEQSGSRSILRRETRAKSRRFSIDSAIHKRGECAIL